MTVIGLTGSFGTGKSFVASEFKALGARVIDADILARQALKKGSRVYKKVIVEFGKDIIDKKGEINRCALASIAFGNKSRLKKLNGFIHPQVIKDIKALVGSAGREAIVVIDAPLLIEAGLAKDVNKLVVVASTRAKQIERCMRKFGMEKKDVLRRIRNQIPLKEKARMADFVIDNDGAKSETKKQVIAIWRKVKDGNS